MQSNRIVSYKLNLQTHKHRLSSYNIVVLFLAWGEREEKNRNAHIIQPVFVVVCVYVWRGCDKTNSRWIIKYAFKWIFSLQNI